MAKFTQASRSMALTTVLGTDALLLAGFEGSEALSRPYHFRLDLLAEQPVAFSALLGQPASIRLDVPGCPRRHVHGILSRLTQVGRVTGSQGLATFIRYRGELVPRLWLLSRRSGSRIFQRMTVPEILSGVFHEWQLDVRLALAEEHPRRDYCVQYRETDLAFVSRLMEAEGIWYCFEHREDGHTLLLGDDPTSHPDLPEGGTLIFDDGQGGQREAVRISAWEIGQEVRSCKYTLRGHSFELPDSDLEARVPIQERVAVGTALHPLAFDMASAAGPLLENFDYPGGYGRHFDSIDLGGAAQPDELKHLFTDNQRTAGLRMQEEAAHAITINAQSNCGHLLPGYRFELTRHFDANGSYIAVAVEHHADLEASYLGGTAEGAFLYDNRLRALPTGLPYRPPRLTPRPTIPGTQPATVVGPPGSDLFLDPYGRVKVRFRWDRRADSGAESSCWIRVSQVWAGQRWGAFFWPRVGHEVIVAFEEGDPDRPIIIGSVYNGKNMPPFPLPENSHLTGFKSFSASGDLANPLNPLVHFNGILFDDKPGEEHLELHGERHIVFNSELDHIHNVAGPHRLNVADTHSVHVGRLSPPGSGSGGSDPFDFSTDTSMPHKTGLAFNAVTGLSAGITLGLASTLTVGDQVTAVVNPLAFFSELLNLAPNPIAAGFTGALGAFFGATNVVTGNQVNLNYGSKLVALRGVRPIITDVRNFKDGEATPQAVLSALLASTATAGVVRAGLEAYDTTQKSWQGLLGTTAGLIGVLGLLDTFLAYKDFAQAKKNAAAAAALGRNQQAVRRTATTLANMFTANQQNMDALTKVKGTKAEYAAGVLQGADEVQMLFAGNQTNQMSVLTLDSQTVKLALTPLLSGPRITLDSTGITLALGTGPTLTQISITANSIVLSFANDTSKVTIDQTGVTLLTRGTNTLKVSQNDLEIKVLKFLLNAQLNAQQQFLQFDQTVTGALKQQIGLLQDL